MQWQCKLDEIFQSLVFECFLVGWFCHTSKHIVAPDVGCLCPWQVPYRVSLPRLKCLASIQYSWMALTMTPRRDRNDSKRKRTKGVVHCGPCGELCWSRTRYEAVRLLGHEFDGAFSSLRPSAQIDMDEGRQFIGSDWCGLRPGRTLSA